MGGDFYSNCHLFTQLGWSGQMTAGESQRVNIIHEVKLFPKALNYQVEVDLRIDFEQF